MLTLFCVLLMVGSVTNQHSSYSETTPPASSVTTTSRDGAPSMNLNNILNKKARLFLDVDVDLTAMAANEKYLLYFNSNRICLIDDKGNEKLRAERIEFCVTDVCWSSCLNQFLILDKDHGKAFSLDESVGGRAKLEEVLDFNETNGILGYIFKRQIQSCTCHRDTLLVALSNWRTESIIEEYNLSNRKSLRTHTPPISCKKNQNISSIRYNSTGSYIGVIVYEGTLGKQCQYFELREPHNMHAIRQIELGFDFFARLLSLPKEFFLVSFHTNAKCFLINSDGTLNETINYDTRISGSALINGKCLVAQTGSPYQLRFYDL